MLSTLLELLGIAALVTAGALVCVPLGLAVLGVALIVLGVAFGGPAGAADDEKEDGQ